MTVDRRDWWKELGPFLWRAEVMNRLWDSTLAMEQLASVHQMMLDQNRDEFPTGCQMFAKEVVAAFTRQDLPALNVAALQLRDRLQGLPVLPPQPPGDPVVVPIDAKLKELEAKEMADPRNRKRTFAYVTIESVEVKLVTEGAVLLECDGNEVWVPRSQIRPSFEAGDSYDRLEVTEWFARKHELI
jgi:hypothetical protein